MIAPVIIFDEPRTAPAGNALTRAARALLIEHRLPYAVQVRLANILKRLGAIDRTVRVAGYRVTCRRASMDELFVNSVLAREEYFRLHDGFRPRPGETVIDVGANIGTFMLAAAKYIGPTGRIVSVEPQPDNVRYFRRNMEQNGIRNVVLIAGAVAASRGSISLFASQESGLHSVSLDHGRGSFMVQAFTLEEIMEQCAIECCDLLKMDCEAAEFDIVPAVKPETWRKIRRIAMEYTVPVRDWSFSSPLPEHVRMKRSMSGELVRILKENGFRIDGYYDCDGHRSGYIFATNELFEDLRTDEAETRALPARQRAVGVQDS